MRGELQGKDECNLATIGDLTRTPLAIVRELALAMAPSFQTWGDLVDYCRRGGPDGTKVYWAGIAHAALQLDPSGSVLDAIRLASHVRGRIAYTAGAKGWTGRKKTLPRKGKGAIVLVPIVDVNGPGHIVPWENGLAYDPNPPLRALTLAELRSRYLRIGYRVVRISLCTKG